MVLDRAETEIRRLGDSESRAQRKRMKTTRTTPHFPIRGARVVRRIPEILERCRGKRVLHLGCTDSPLTSLRGDQLLHVQLSRVTAEENLWGLDQDAEGLAILRTLGFRNLVEENAESDLESLRRRNFEIVLAGEILEHLDNPGNFLAQMRSILTPGAELLLTTVNATSVKGFVHSLLRREKVHPDHNYYFSYRTVQQLLEKHDLACREVYYYQEVEGSGLTKLFEQSIALLPRWSPAWSDGLIVRAELRALDSPALASSS